MKRLAAILALSALLLASCGKNTPPKAEPGSAQRTDAATEPETTKEEEITVPPTPFESLDRTQTAVFRGYADTARSNLFEAFWDSENRHFLRTAEGQPNKNAPAIWEAAQSCLALVTYYEATQDADALAKIRDQWAYLQSDAYKKEILTGARKLGSGCYYAQDDAAWGAMEFLAIWRATRDPVALEWAHDLIVNSYRYWGTGETKAFAGTEMPDLSESLYYTRNLSEGEVLFQSIYAVPMLLAALEYCTASNPEDPTAVDLFTPTLNAFHWLEDNLCRKTSRYYADYDKSGSCVVTCTDKLYFVDYGRHGEKGPTGARAAEVISPHGSNTALFGNMGMAACAGMLWRITGKEDYRTVALRTVKAITTTETHRTTGTYINDRDQGTNASTAGYFVRYALTLDGVRARDLQVLQDTAKRIATACPVPDTPYYYTVWNEDPAGNIIYYPTDSRVPAYTCQPRLANCVHIVTAALFLLTVRQG